MTDKTKEFADAVKRALEIDVEVSRLEEERRGLMRRLLALTGLKVGSIVQLNHTEQGVLNSVRASFEGHPVDEAKWVLAVEGEASPITKDGKPSEREKRRRFYRIFPEYTAAIDPQMPRAEDPEDGDAVQAAE